ncbi:oxidoreductase [Allonocardiopsis opalescens]|uniref:Short-subunit dehydrogenase n=1 Tax=Allonocardiopsis opalescens TaxID=1144618 RepID=A0A2T0QAS7_9ACTN|nr:oxidoreductase [Allonocardiopsis opalescens]PRY00912.1 short-subunit dehydrogenase [Allonocardiopsis opalescens]
MSGRNGWSAADIPPQHGRLALVTGAAGGIGLETALGLARAGATVLLAGRKPEALDRAAAGIARRAPGADLEHLVLDLADLSSVERAAEQVLTAGRPLDLLVNNAGVMAVPERRTTADGFELTFGTNHLGHFALTGRLLPALLKAEAARVVTVSAMASRWRSAALADVNSEGGYRPMRAYALSKFANVVFTEELDRRAAGTDLHAMAAHPGTSDTGIQRHGSSLVRWLTRTALEPVLGHSPERAALPSLYAATDPTVPGGAFIGPGGAGESRGAPTRVPLPRGADDPETGRALWELSERLTGVGYSWD